LPFGFLFGFLDLLQPAFAPRQLSRQLVAIRESIPAQERAGGSAGPAPVCATPLGGDPVNFAYAAAIATSASGLSCVTIRLYADSMCTRIIPFIKKNTAE
jgi:hypothetical protein